MAAEIGSSVAEKAIDSLYDHIQRECGYLLCFNNNIQGLETGLRKLKAAINDVQAKEDAEKRSRRTLGEGVKLWIEDADEKITEAEKVIEDKAELQKGCFSIKWCPNLKLRFSLGRKGKKLSLLLKELLQRGGELQLTGSDLPMTHINMRDYTGDASDFESRKKIMEEIIEMLMEKETRLIGICGMGGIGKTTLAKQVLQKVHDFHNNLFEFQVISTVSRPPNFNAIQQQVIEMLGGSSLKEIDNETLRAERLRRAFDNKKVVVLLDDVWEEFDLNGKGFPLRESDCCKIIYTSRTQGLWLGINKKEISLDVLLNDEASNLFRRKANLHEDDNDFHSKNEIAIKIVDECKGLPLALEVAGGALKEKNTYHWEDMLCKLQSQHEHHSEKVHKVLETSYGCLEDPISKNIFLLCCLFPEDSLILIETLYRYAMGLQLFKGTMNDLYHIRNRVYTLVDDLITRNLLINDEDMQIFGRVVKMHDVVRDVGLSIAKQEEKDIHFLICDEGVNQLQNYVAPNTKMISILFLESGLKVPDDVMEFRGSKLELLRLHGDLESVIEISWNLFQGADDLKVLDIIGVYKFSEFPYSSPFPYLAKLKMLSLEYMDLNITSNVSFIKHLTSLETLSFRWSEMETLSNEVGELRNLKVLDLTYCRCFINDGILSRLTNLQELYMWGSFDDWKSTLKEEDILNTIGEDNNNAAKLIELNCLHELRRLELIVLNIEQVPRNVRLFSSSTLLKQFKISIGEGGTRRYENKFESSERSLWVEGKNVEDGVNLFDALGVLIKNDITSLCIYNDSNMSEKMYVHRHLSAMKHIILEHCGGSMITLFVPCNNYKEDVQKIEFNILETLELRWMDQLTCFCKGINEIYFHRLRSLKLIRLGSFILPTKIEIPQLKHLEIIFIPSIITLCNIVAPSLQELEIDHCYNLKYIFSSNSLTVKNIFHLQNLTITNCKRLKGVIKILSDTEEQPHISIKLSNLMNLKLEYLNKLSSFVIHVNHLDDEDEEENEEKPQNALFYCDENEEIVELVSLPCLRELSLCHLSKINYIIGWKGRQCHHRDIEEGRDKEILQPFFPNLKSLNLGSFCQLVSFVGFINPMDGNSEKQNALFYPDDDEVSFSCLEELAIENLSKIKYIVARKGREGRTHHRNIEEGYDRTVEPQFFPNLSTLRLYNLEQLVSFVVAENNMDDKSEKHNALFYQDDEVSFPSLRELWINKLSKINYIVGCKRGKGENNDIIEEKDDYDNKLQPPIFPILKDLLVHNLSNLIHMYQSNHPEGGVLLFQNVRRLDIANCEKLRYLFSKDIGRVAANNLEELFIVDCRMMELVMKNEEELGGEDDKAKRAGTICHYFPLLHTLVLRGLLGLRRFCDVALTLPSLSLLEVTRCPKLEALSPGYLDTPRLTNFNYNQSKLIAENWKGDVNAALCDKKKDQNRESMIEDEDEDEDEDD